MVFTPSASVVPDLGTGTGVTLVGGQTREKGGTLQMFNKEAAQAQAVELGSLPSTGFSPC